MKNQSPAKTFPIKPSMTHPEGYSPADRQHPGLRVDDAKNAGLFTGNKTPKAPIPAIVPQARKR
jgi:hypothetical protein